LPQEINDTRSTDVCMVGVKWIVRRLSGETSSHSAVNHREVYKNHRIPIVLYFFQGRAKIVFYMAEVGCGKFEYSKSDF
jgi:hypothetical protein